MLDDAEYMRLGLPPRRPRGVWSGWLRGAAAVGLAVALVAAALGWISGRFVYRWRVRAFAADAIRFAARVRPAEADAYAGELARLRAARLPLAGSPQARLAMAVALRRLAETGPARRFNLEGARAELDTGAIAGRWESLAPELRGQWLELQALTLLELGDDVGALAAMDASDAISPRRYDRESRAVALNNRAFLHATAKSPLVAQPEAALELARQAAMMRPAGGAEAVARWSAATLDTLAAAYQATGSPERAANAETMALALADGSDIFPYLERFDRIAGTGGAPEPRKR